MEFTRNYMIGYLLLFCTTEEEYEKEEERLLGLTDEALEAEFTAQYNSLQGARPSHPLCEGRLSTLCIRECRRYGPASQKPW